MDDIDSELLALLDTNPKRKSKSSKSDKDASKSSKPKRKRPEKEDSASDMDMSSDEDIAPPPSRKSKVDYGERDDSDDEEEEEHPFPLEGKYIDEDDRHRIHQMTELEREEILGERQELLSDRAAKRQLKQMVKAKRAESGGSALATSTTVAEDVRTGGRERKATGTTTEKRETLEKLKRKREAKGKRAERRDDDDDYEAPSSPRRRRSSYDDPYSDDGSDEEGEVNKSALTSSSAFNKSSKSSSNKPAMDLVGPTEFKDIVVSRIKLSKLCAAPWFADWVKGAWVRYLVGTDNGENQYRICQVESIKEDSHKSYRFENVTTNIQLELRHGDAVRFFPMDAVSNSPITDREFARLTQALSAFGSHLPTVKEAKKMKEQLAKHTEYRLTEADISALLAKKGLHGALDNSAKGKAKLLVERNLAHTSGDHQKVSDINAQLASYDSPSSPSRTTSNGGGAVGFVEEKTEAERMRLVNERNRASNREDIKRAEAKSVDERRKLAQKIARGDQDVYVDPSARVKTMTRLTYDRDASTSRPSTPVPGTPRSGIDTPPVHDPSKHIPIIQSKLAEAAKAIQVDVDFDF